MESAHLEIDGELSVLLSELGAPIQQTVREMIVFELYRRNVISSGRAATLLHVPRLDFIHRASALGIPYFRFTEKDWEAEVAESKRT